MPRLSRNSNRLLLGVLVLFCGYAAGFIWRTSFVIDATRYFSLFDDGMVSMRYARNLAHGAGLVWNPGGERVEGYTNLLWTLYMAVLHLLPVSPAKISLLVQLTGLVALAADLAVVALLSSRLSGGSNLAVGTTVLLTASYLPLNNWGLQGMEVSLLALLVSLSTFLTLQRLDGAPVPLLLYPLLGVGTLVRLDMVVPFGAILLALLFFDRARWRTHLTLGAITLLLCVGGQTLFRWLYYGDLLPNTYYLKMTGYPIADRISRGAVVLGEWGVRLLLGLLLLLPGMLGLPRDRRTALVLGVVIAQAAYSVYVGGDAWEWAGGSNRYLAVVMPLVFVLVGAGVSQLAQAWTSNAKSTASANPVRAILAVMVGITVIAVNAATEVTVVTPRYGAPGSWKTWLLLQPPFHVEDNAAIVRFALGLKAATTESTTVAVVWAGALPYFLDRRAVDLLGKSDPVIARRPMRRAFQDGGSLNHRIFFWPGHLKYDYAYSIGQQRPDIVAGLWHDAEEAWPSLEADYVTAWVAGHFVYLRRGSRAVDWGHVSPAFARY